MAKQDMSEEEAGMMPDGIDDNLLSEILLRLPPLPSSLPRASAVCRRWYGLASDPCFCRRFRRRHRRNAPLLGLFDTYHKFLPFLPTLDAPNSVLPARFSLPLLIRAGEYLDCEARHGLLLFFDEDEEHPHFLVWDPVTGDQTRLEMPPGFEEPTSVRGAVLRDAGDVHFRVVVAVGDNEDSQQRRALARVYSSQTDLWGDLISMPIPPTPDTSYLPMFPSVLVGDSLYWQLRGSNDGILEFNLERQSLDVIRVPVDMMVIREEGGGMGFLSLSGWTAQLWKRKTDSDGVQSWLLGRTIELDKLLSLDPDEHQDIRVLAYAEENNYVFLRTAVGLFMLQLQSLQFTLIKTNISYCLPFECVYTAETRKPEAIQYIGWKPELVEQITKLQDDNRALDRLTKQKEAALLEAERTIEIAMAKAAMVDDLQNRNQDLMKQIEIFHEENKILDKLHRHKVAEVENLSQTVRELEEAVLQGGAAANAVRDYQRKVQEMNGERKTLDRELARAKVTSNRVTGVVANEWKDSNDKLMPVKQWLEERRFLQGEMNQLRDKLAIAERAARSEAQLKETYQLRLKVLEDGLRGPRSSRPPTEGKSFRNAPSRQLSLGGVDNMSKLPPNGLLTRRSPSFHSRSSLSSSSSLILKHAKGTSKSFVGGTRSLDRGKVHGNGSHVVNRSTDAVKDHGANDCWKGTVDERTNESANSNADERSNETTNSNSIEMVSGFLYNMLQKEVISLRKSCHEKDQSLKDKDDAIEMLVKKVDALTKAMEVEAKKMRREVAAMEKEVAAMRVDKDQEIKARRLGNSKGSGSSQLLPGRSAPRSGLTRNFQ